MRRLKRPQLDREDSHWWKVPLSSNHNRALLRECPYVFGQTRKSQFSITAESKKTLSLKKSSLALRLHFTSKKRTKVEMWVVTWFWHQTSWNLSQSQRMLLRITSCAVDVCVCVLFIHILANLFRRIPPSTCWCIRANCAQDSRLQGSSRKWKSVL